MTDLAVLPQWLDAGGAVLDGAVAPAASLADSLPGLSRARQMGPLQRLQHVQQAGLAECGPSGEPVYVAWRQFLRGHGPSTLVIDATGLDARAQGSVTVLDRASLLLAEGVLIGAGLRDSRTVELRLPAELAGHEAALLNAVDALRSLAHVEGRPASTSTYGATAGPAAGAKAGPPTTPGWSTPPRPGVAWPCSSPTLPAPRRRC